MNIDQKIEREVEDIIRELECPKHFRCYRSGFKDLCPAEDIGVNLFLECRDDRPEQCKFALLMGSSYLCQCSLRYYIFKKLKK
ncbi:MAG: hypothetical protein JRI36_06085 [Deltaproteobacteria bacterium]|nr:hypothetical protein [Deltaproteobacteria bacterium]